MLSKCEVSKLAFTKDCFKFSSGLKAADFRKKWTAGGVNDKYKFCVS